MALSNITYVPYSTNYKAKDNGSTFDAATGITHISGRTASTWFSPWYSYVNGQKYYVAKYTDIYGVEREIELQFNTNLDVSNYLFRGSRFTADCPDTDATTAITVYTRGLSYYTSSNQKLIGTDKWKISDCTWESDTGTGAMALNTCVVQSLGDTIAQADLQYYLNGEYLTTPLTVSADGMTASLPEPIQAVAVARVLPIITWGAADVPPTVTNNISDCEETHTYTAETGVTDITLTCADGYTFNNAIATYVENGTEKQQAFAVVGGAATTSVHADVNTNITLSGNVVKIVVPPTVTNNIADASETHTYDASTKQTSITLTCADGYTFNNAIATYTDTYGSTSTANFNVTGNNATLTIKAATDTDITLTGNVVKIVVPPTVTNNISHTTEMHTYDEETDTTELTITADADYLFTNLTITYTPVGSSEQTIMPTEMVGTTEYYVQLSTDPNSVITVSGHVGKNMSVLTDLHECDIVGVDSVIQGQTYIARVTPVSYRYYFDPNELPYIEYTDSFGATVKFEGTFDGEETVTFNFDTTLARGTSITVHATAVYGYENRYGNLYVYTPDTAELLHFSEKRYFTKAIVETTSAYAGIYENVDLGNYVVSLKTFPFSIPNSENTTVIRCGNYNTGVETTVPKNEIIIQDFGDITLPTYDNSTADYDTTYELFLPFKGFVDIPSKYAGETIHLQYVSDIVTGHAAILLTHNDMPFEVYDIEIAQDYLFKAYNANDTGSTVGGTNIANLNAWGLEPFIRVTHRPVINADAVHNTEQHITIGDCDGLCTFKDCTIIGGIPYNELTEIHDILANGVHVAVK